MKMQRKIANILVIVGFLALILAACSSEEKPKHRGLGSSGDAAHSAMKEKSTREYKLEHEKKLKRKRVPCDTLSLEEYVLENYPAGTLLVVMDRTTPDKLPKPAVIYYRKGGKKYVFALLAKSKPGERNIETKNVVGYESSFINLDSTKLGTAFFFLTLYECVDNNFHEVWAAPVPIHGGFNRMKLKRWKPKNILYIELNYEDGIISGHRNYNFFLVDGIRKPPHLLETYVGIAHKRTMTDLNHDKYPDYYEYRYIDSTYYVKLVDSIPFYWDTTRKLYVTKVNPRWTRPY